MKRKKGLILALVAVAVLGTVIMGCAKEVAPEEVAPEEVAPEEVSPAEPEEVYEWTHLHCCTYAAVPWLADPLFKLEEMSQGRIKLKFLGWGEFPYSYTDLLPALERGECDSIYTASSIIDANDPRFGIFDMPLMIYDLDAAADLCSDPKYEETFRLFLEPLDDWNAKGLIFWPCCQGFAMKDMFVDSVDALEGKQVRSTGYARAKMVEAFGGTAVAMEFGEVATAVERGMLDGVGSDWDSLYHTGLADVLKSYTFSDYGAHYNMIMMNKDSLARMPDDLKAMVLDYCDQYNRKLARDGEYARQGWAIINGAENDGVQFRGIPPDVLAEARKRMEPFWHERAKDIPDGEERLATVIQFFNDWREERNLPY